MIWDKKLSLLSTYSEKLFMMPLRLPYTQPNRIGKGIKKNPIKEKPVATPTVIKTKKTPNPRAPLTPEQIAAYEAKKVREQKTREIVKEKVKQLCLRGLPFLDVSIRLQNQGYKASPGFVQVLWKDIRTKDPSLVKQRFEATELRINRGGLKEVVFKQMGFESQPKVLRSRKKQPLTKQNSDSIPQLTQAQKNSQNPPKSTHTKVIQSPRILQSSMARALIPITKIPFEKTQRKPSTVFDKVESRLAPWQSKRKKISTMPKTYKEDVNDFLNRTGIKPSNFEKMLNRYKNHFGNLRVYDPSSIADKLRNLRGQEKININYSELILFAQWASTRKWRELRK